MRFSNEILEFCLSIYIYIYMNVLAKYVHYLFEIERCRFSKKSFTFHHATVIAAAKLWCMICCDVCVGWITSIMTSWSEAFCFSPSLREKNQVTLEKTTEGWLDAPTLHSRNIFLDSWENILRISVVAHTDFSYNTHMCLRFH